MEENDGFDPNALRRNINLIRDRVRRRLEDNYLNNSSRNLLSSYLEVLVEENAKLKEEVDILKNRVSHAEVVLEQFQKRIVGTKGVRNHEIDKKTIENSTRNKPSKNTQG